ncbi:MAG: hypothetical protein WC614_12630 [bacterium]
MKLKINLILLFLLLLSCKPANFLTDYSPYGTLIFQSSSAEGCDSVFESIDSTLYADSLGNYSFIKIKLTTATNYKLSTIRLYMFDRTLIYSKIAAILYSLNDTIKLGHTEIWGSYGKNDFIDLSGWEPVNLTSEIEYSIEIFCDKNEDWQPDIGNNEQYNYIFLLFPFDKDYTGENYSYKVVDTKSGQSYNRTETPIHLNFELYQ